MKKAGRYFVLVVNFLLLVLWTYTATSKFIDHTRFERTLFLSPLMPVQASATLLSWLVPILEVFAATCLLVDRLRLKGFYFSLALLLSFECYIILALSSGQHLPCSCGGVIAKMSWKQHVVFNAAYIMLTLAAIGIFLLNMRKKPAASRTL